MSLESRRLLGHHLTPDAVSAETYSRDSMGPAVRDLLNVLRMIKQGSFMPDLSRSGRFSKEHFQQDQQASQDSQDERQDSDSDYKPGDSDTSVSSSSDKDRPESRLWSIVSPPLRPRARKTPAGATVYRHVISGIQHLATQASSNENKLVCGRRLNCRWIRRGRCATVRDMCAQRRVIEIDGRKKRWMLMSIAHMSGLMTAMCSHATAGHVSCWPGMNAPRWLQSFDVLTYVL